MVGKRLTELLAIGMIGEGIAGLLAPRGYPLLWKFGPRPYQELIRALAAHPGRVWIACLIEVSLGVWLTMRETSRQID